MTTPVAAFELIEFQVLLLIHAANCDFDYHSKEKDFIIEKFGEEMHDKMLSIYQKNKHSSFTTVMRDFLIYCENKDVKSDTLLKLNSILNADGEYNTFEEYFEKTFAS